MQRTLWLKFERPPHPDAVVHPANVDELHLVMRLLELPQRERQRLSEHLRNWLSAVDDQAPWDRPAALVRFGEGLYQPIPWRLAKWLACVFTHRRWRRHLHPRADSPVAGKREQEPIVDPGMTYP